MTEQKVRTYNGWAFWLAIAITLGPLAVMPLAKNTRFADQVGMQQPVAEQAVSERTS